MIVPRMLVLPLVPVGVGVGVSGGVVGGGDGGVDDGELLDGGEVCLVFEGAAEDGWLPGLDDFPDFPDFPAPGVENPVPLAATAPCLPCFLCPDRDVVGLGVFTAGAAFVDGTDGASAELTGGDV
jgi:hypothetical protein